MNFNKICVDASLAIAWLSFEQHTGNVNALWREWRERGVEMVCPAMFYAEVTSVLREQVFFKRILPEEGEEAFSICLDIPIRVIDGAGVYRKAWNLAKEYNLPRTYDMQYLAVAELEDCEFWTADRKLVDSLKGKDERVRWVGELSK
jgi:predicted nucleic acid-binding protein